MIDLEIEIGKLKLKNPVILCSGTFSEELSCFFDLRKLGGIISKTITLRPHTGNLPPRTCEVTAGLLNSIGLENPGLEVFIKKDLPRLLKFKVPLIVSIGTVDKSEDLFILTKELDKIKEINSLELNISCPNIKIKRLIAQDKSLTYRIVKKVRNFTNKTLIVKLSPNVTDITEIAYAVKKADADGISLINTLLGMAIDVNTRRPKISTAFGGLSGPAIKPIALRMVWQVYKDIKIPIVGMGGIMNAEDALEFIICGATAVGIGTANFINPSISLEIIKGIKRYLIRNKLKKIKELIGTLKV